MTDKKITLFHAFQRDQRGTIAVIASLTMAVAITAIGMAVDYGRAHTQQTDLQRAIDAAVLAGGASDSAIRVQVATEFFAANYSARFANANTPVFVSTATKLQGTVTANVPTVLTQIIGIDSLSISATATVVPSQTSATIPGSLPCFLALDKSKAGAFTLISAHDLNAPECEMHVHSTDSHAFTYSEPSAVVFKSIEVKGGAYKSEGTGTIANIHAPSTHVADDPFADLIPKVVSGVSPADCKSGGTFNAVTGFTYTGTVTPGTYCGPTTFAGNSVSMTPGLYIFRSGDMGVTVKQGKKSVTLSGGLTVTAKTIKGHGVTFYFADQASALNGYSSKEDNHLHAPTSGRYAGILMFEKAGLQKRTITIANADKQSWQGLVYVPSWDLRLMSISDWPHTEDMRAWNGVEPSMNIAMVVNTLYSDSLSKFHHTPFAFGSPEVRLPGTTTTKLTTNFGVLGD
jgi:Flp pilus assembly protein TadG